MKNQLSPAMVAVILGVVLVVVVVIGYKMLASGGFKADKTGSEQSVKKAQEQGYFYKPPAGAPIPGMGGAGNPTGPPTGR